MAWEVQVLKTKDIEVLDHLPLNEWYGIALYYFRREALKALKRYAQHNYEGTVFHRIKKYKKINVMNEYYLDEEKKEIK